MELQEEDNKVVFENAEEVNSEVKCVRELVIDTNSESVKETPCGNDLSSDGSSTIDKEEAEAKDKSPLVEDSGILKEAKDITNSIVESADLIVSLKEELTVNEEVSVEKSEDSDSCVSEVEAKEVEENNILPCSNDTVTDMMSNKVEETPSSLTSSEIDGDVSEAVRNENEEIKLPSCDEKDGLSSGAIDVVSKGIEEKVIPSLDENCGPRPALTDVASKAIEEAQAVALEQTNGGSSRIVGKESVESIEDSSLEPLANASVIGSGNGFPESTANPVGNFD